jgi:uncharacterized RDD family membrane protein YckC
MKCSRCGRESEDSANYCISCGAEIEKYPKPVGFWIRVCALLIDDMIFIPISIISMLNYMLFKNIILFILITLPCFLYKPVMESRYGATLGKMACGIRVIDGIGQKITLEAAYFRFLPFLLISIPGTIQNISLYMSPEFESAKTLKEITQLQQPGPLNTFILLAIFFLLADCIFAAFTYRKRTLHDMLVGSYCVYKQSQLQQSQNQQSIYQSIQ